MEAKSLFLHSNTLPHCHSLQTDLTSLLCITKHLHLKSHHHPQTLKPLKTSSRSYVPQNPLLLSSPTTRTTHFLTPVKFSNSSTTTSPEPHNPTLLKPFNSFSFDSLKDTLFKSTPFDVIKWSGILSIAAAKWTSNLLLSPFFWMYFSWSWMFWTWLVAVSIGLYGFYCFRKHLVGEASNFEITMLAGMT